MKSTTTRVWAKKGSAITVKVKQGYKSFYIYSGVSPHSGESFSLFLPSVNTEMMNIYLKELGNQYKKKKILLIMDQAGWHKSKELKIPKNIKIIFLPPYSPELNPIEKLWFWLKKEVAHNRVYKTINELMDTLEKEFKKFTDWQLLNLCYCNYL